MNIDVHEKERRLGRAMRTALARGHMWPVKPLLPCLSDSGTFAETLQQYDACVIAASRRLLLVVAVGAAAVLNVQSAAAVSYPDRHTVTDPTHTLYRTWSKSQSGSAPQMELATLSIPAGSTRYLSAKLFVSDPSSRAEVAAFIQCGSERSIASQNVPLGDDATLLVRGVFTAPAGGSVTCFLKGSFVNHVSEEYGTITVEPTSYLEDVQGPVSYWRQTEQGTRELVNSAYQAAKSTSFSIPTGKTSFKVIGDTTITTCYEAYSEIESGAPCNAPGARLDGPDSLVGTRLVVQQYNADGTTCGAAWTNGPVDTTLVTNYVHHYHLNTWGTVSVNSSCTSRQFVMWLRVSAGAEHNSLIVENADHTLTAAIT